MTLANEVARDALARGSSPSRPTNMMEIVWITFCRRNPAASGAARRTCFFISAHTSPRAGAATWCRFSMVERAAVLALWFSQCALGWVLVTMEMEDKEQESKEAFDSSLGSWKSNLPPDTKGIIVDLWTKIWMACQLSHRRVSAASVLKVRSRRGNADV